MNNTQLFVTIIIIGVVTFFFRFSFIYLYGRFQLPEWITKAMHFAPAAVMSALIFPAIIIDNNTLWISPQNPRLTAGIFAMFIAWRTKNLLITIISGLGFFWLLLFLLN